MSVKDKKARRTGQRNASQLEQIVPDTTLWFLGNIDTIRTRAIILTQGFYNIDEDSYGRYRVIMIDGTETWTTITVGTNSFKISNNGEIAQNKELTASDKKLRYIPKDRKINVKCLGAVGDSASDDTIPIQTSVNIGYNVYLPNPDAAYKISSSIDCRKTGLSLCGESANHTIIRQATDNVPILLIGGERLNIQKLKLEYANAQPLAYTNANAIEIYALYESELNLLYINNCNSGLYIKQSLYNDTGNYMYSCTIKNIRINRYTNYGMYLKPYNAGNSGSILSNIYITSMPDGIKNTITCGLYMDTFGESTLQQINIEHCKPKNAIVFSNCKNITASSIHFEDLEPIDNYNAFIDLLGSNTSVFISGLEFKSCSLLVANLTNRYSVFRTQTGVTLKVINVQTESMTITVPNFSMVYSSSCTDADLSFEGIKTTDITQRYSLPTSTSGIPQVRKYNDSLYYYEMGGNKVFYGTAIPTSGTYAIGDIVVNTTIAELGTTGSKYIIDRWRCITAGTPGTWVQNRVLTGN